MRTLITISILFLLCSSACLRGSEKSDFYKKYQSLDSPQHDTLIKEALSSLRSKFGSEAIPVTKVYLRLSTPIKPDSALKKDFRVTEIVDEERGEFALHVNRKPGEYAFVGQLAHQVFFLLNARLHDCYAAGLSTYFAELFVKEKGLDWSGWQSHLEQGNQPLYGSSYFMIKELNRELRGLGLRSLPGYAVWTDMRKSRMHIDIKAWIASLEAESQKKAIAVIHKHLPAIKKQNAQRDEPLSCLSPPDGLN